MARPSISNLFGVGATYSAGTGLTIPRSALVASGLANPDTANAEQLMAAIIVNSAAWIVPNTDEAVNISVETDYTEPVPRNSLDKRQDRYIYELYSPALGVAGVDPDTLA